MGIINQLITGGYHLVESWSICQTCFERIQPFLLFLSYKPWRVFLRETCSPKKNPKTVNTHSIPGILNNTQQNPRTLCFSRRNRHEQVCPSLCDYCRVDAGQMSGGVNMFWSPDRNEASSLSSSARQVSWVNQDGKMSLPGVSAGKLQGVVPAKILDDFGLFWLMAIGCYWRVLLCWSSTTRFHGQDQNPWEPSADTLNLRVGRLILRWMPAAKGVLLWHLWLQGIGQSGGRWAKTFCAQECRSLDSLLQAHSFDEVRHVLVAAPLIWASFNALPPTLSPWLRNSALKVDILRLSVLGREYDALRSAERFLAAGKVTSKAWAGGNIEKTFEYIYKMLEHVQNRK